MAVLNRNGSALHNGLRIHVLAWRDLDAPDAGGAERHTHELVRRWAMSGVHVTQLTAAVPSQPVVALRDGYGVVRKGGRYSSFARTVAAEVSGQMTDTDVVVEVWNGVPFASPLWFRGPKLVSAHHLHGELWKHVLPRGWAQAGRMLERTIAPRMYRSVPVIVPSKSSKTDFVARTALKADQIHVIEPGVEDRFGPGRRSEHPLVVAVGRLMPLKRFDVLVAQLARVKERVPNLRAVIVGTGPCGELVAQQIRDLGAVGWIEMTGRVDDSELLEFYQRAWLVAAASTNEGWGMTLTEAARCETPAVATRTAGHTDSVHHGSTGLLVDSDDALGDAMAQVLSDPTLRDRLGQAAGERARKLGWEASADQFLQLIYRQLGWDTEVHIDRQFEPSIKLFELRE